MQYSDMYFIPEMQGMTQSQLIYKCIYINEPKNTNYMIFPFMQRKKIYKVKIHSRFKIKIKNLTQNYIAIM